MTADPWPELGPLAGLTYLLAPQPPPGRAMGRLEIVTSGGGSGSVSMPAIKITTIGGGNVEATAEDAGITWCGTGSSTTAAVLALLADRIGYQADVRLKEEDAEDGR